MKVIETYITGGLDTQAFIWAIALMVIGLLGLIIIIIMCDKYRETDNMPMPTVICAILVCIGIWLGITAKSPRITHKVVEVNNTVYERFCKEYSNNDTWEIEEDVAKSGIHEITIKEKNKE